MTASRPTARRAAAGILALTAGVSLWQTDPVWARAAGLDVWNLGRLESQVSETDVVRDRLAAREEYHARLFAVNRVIVADAMAGTRTLASAADELYQLNQDVCGYRCVLTTSFRGPTTQARAADNLIQRARHTSHLSDADRRAVVARLEAEYEAMYGVPASHRE